jgi:hypothetical protein
MNHLSIVISRLVSFSLVEFKLIRVARDLDPIAVGIEKTDRPITGHDQCLRSADDRDPAALQNRMKFIDDIVLIDVDAEMMQLRRSLARHVSHAPRQRLQRDVVMLSAVAHESHLRVEIARRNFETEDRAIKLFRLLEIGDIEHDMAERTVSDFHGKALLNNDARILSRRGRCFDESI